MTKRPIRRKDGMRHDGWWNPLTGFGTERDKSEGTFFFAPVRLRDRELSDLYHYDAIARRIVNDRVDEMFRRGYEIELEAANPAALEKLEDRAKQIGVCEKVEEATRLARAYGGSAIVMFVNDGRDLSMPLVSGRGRGLSGLLVLDRRSITATSYYGPGSALPEKVGTPEFYQVASANGLAIRVHESRVIPFYGAYTDPILRRELASWGLSVLQAPYDILKKFMQAFQSAGGLLLDMSQAVFKLKGLWEMVHSNQKDKIQERMRLVDMNRSSIRAIVIDSEEEFKREPTPLTGLSDTLEQFMLLFGAAIDTPLSRIFGKAPQGMNATGESETRQWYASIESEQVKSVTPKLRQIYTAMASEFRIDPNDIEIEWCPLWAPSEKEQADTEKVHVDTHVALIQEGVIDPLEARLVLAGVPLRTLIDVEKTRAELETAMRVKEEPPVPAPQPPPTGAAQPPIEDDGAPEEDTTEDE